MKARILIAGVLITTVACAGSDGYNGHGSNDVISGMIGLRAECLSINDQFDVLLGKQQGERLNCGSGEDVGDGDYINIAFAKVQSNLAMLEVHAARAELNGKREARPRG